VSGHSTFSAAAAQVIRSFTGSDSVNLTVNFAAGSSFVEPGAVPATTVQLRWSTLSAAADEAGLSRELGGIHFQHADAHGLNLGRAVGTNTLNKAQIYFQGLAGGWADEAINLRRPGGCWWWRAASGSVRASAQGAGDGVRRCA
jgi:hypothetical protein